MRPKKAIDSSQAWFWSREWLKKEEEVEADYRARRYKTAKNAREFLRKLHSKD